MVSRLEKYTILLFIDILFDVKVILENISV